MSQRGSRKYRSAITKGVLASLLLIFSACGYDSLKDFATANSVERGGTGANPNGDPGALLVAEKPIHSGQVQTSGSIGVFKKILIGDADTISLEKPVGVSGRGNFLYVVDADKRVVVKVDLETRFFTLFATVGSYFVGDPGKIYVDDDFSFYITDAVGKRVIKFDAEGKMAGTFSEPSNLSRPIDVKVVTLPGSNTKEVWVADGSYSHIVRFDMNGVALSRIGQRGTGEGRFRAITGFTVVDNDVYIVDRLEFPIQVLDINGSFKTHFGDNLLRYPTAVEVEPQLHYTFVSDKLDNYIYIFQAGVMAGKVGGTGSAPGRFREIGALWTDGQKLYVADTLNKRVQVMRIQSAITTVPTKSRQIP